MLKSIPIIAYNVDIGPAGRTLGIGTGNVCAFRTGPGPNHPPITTSFSLLWSMIHTAWC